PDFLEDLISNNLLDAPPRGAIRMELLCQIALERSIPDVSNGVVAGAIVADFGSSFAQLRLCHQGTDLPALPLLLAPAQSFDLLLSGRNPVDEGRRGHARRASCPLPSWSGPNGPSLLLCCNDA